MVTKTNRRRIIQFSIVHDGDLTNLYGKFTQLLLFISLVVALTHMRCVYCTRYRLLPIINIIPNILYSINNDELPFLNTYYDVKANRSSIHCWQIHRNVYLMFSAKQSGFDVWSNSLLIIIRLSLPRPVSRWVVVFIRHLRVPVTSSHQVCRDLEFLFRKKNPIRLWCGTWYIWFSKELRGCMIIAT